MTSTNNKTTNVYTVRWTGGDSIVCESEECDGAEFRYAARNQQDPYDDYDDHKLECMKCRWPCAFAEGEVEITLARLDVR